MGSCRGSAGTCLRHLRSRCGVYCTTTVQHRAYMGVQGLLIGTSLGPIPESGGDSALLPMSFLYMCMMFLRTPSFSRCACMTARDRGAWKPGSIHSAALPDHSTQQDNKAQAQTQASTSFTDWHSGSLSPTQPAVSTLLLEYSIFSSFTSNPYPLPSRVLHILSLSPHE